MVLQGGACLPLKHSHAKAVTPIMQVGLCLGGGGQRLKPVMMFKFLQRRMCWEDGFP